MRGDSRQTIYPASQQRPCRSAPAARKDARPAWVRRAFLRLVQPVFVYLSVTWVEGVRFGDRRAGFSYRGLQAPRGSPILRSWKMQQSATWTTPETLLDRATRRYSLYQNGDPMTVGQWLEGLASNAAFRAYFNACLARSPLPAFFFETPAVTLDTLGALCEWVLVDGAPLLRTHSDDTAFAQHFATDALAVTFANLGGDAQLVVPTPRVEAEVYVHLANFVRRAPPPQVDYFWQLVGVTCQRALSNQPLWVSTSGLGVGWLHVRLDARPKYYNHAPYAA